MKKILMIFAILFSVFAVCTAEMTEKGQRVFKQNFIRWEDYDWVEYSHTDDWSEIVYLSEDISTVYHLFNMPEDISVGCGKDAFTDDAVIELLNHINSSEWQLIYFGEDYEYRSYDGHCKTVLVQYDWPEHFKHVKYIISITVMKDMLVFSIRSPAYLLTIYRDWKTKY